MQRFMILYRDELNSLMHKLRKRTDAIVKYQEYRTVLDVEMHNVSM